MAKKEELRPGCLGAAVAFVGALFAYYPVVNSPVEAEPPRDHWWRWAGGITMLVGAAWSVVACVLDRRKLRRIRKRKAEDKRASR